MLKLLLIVAVVSTPFTDAKKRFSLDLPAGWEQGPVAADASGASFRCTMGEKMALAAVRVVPASSMNAAAVARKLGQPMETQPGYRLVEEGSAELAGRPAARRRYVAFVDGNPEMIKTAEDRAIVAEGKGYVIHVESLSSTFFDFENDFNHMFDTFRLGAKPGAVKDAGSPLIGKWLMDGTSDTFLELRADGAFDLAGTTGTYRAQGQRLLMWMTGGGMEEFTFRLDGSDALVLTSPNLGEPIRYSRTGGADNPLVGAWTGGGRELVLETDAKASVDGKAATWRIDGKKLILKVAGKKRVVRYTITGDVLVLKGWKYGKGTKLERK